MRNRLYQVKSGSGVALVWAAIALTHGCGGSSSTAVGTPTTSKPTAQATTISQPSGTGQSTFVATPVPVAPSVQVRDQSGSPMAGVSVLFAVGLGGGSITGATQSTDASGVAAVGSWTLGPNPGTNTLVATAGALTTTFSATGTAAALVVRNATEAVNGDTLSPMALIANPGSDGISLREALTAANRSASPISISFDASLAGQTIRLTRRFAPVTRDDITVTGLLSNGQPAITIDASSATNPGPILFVAASSFTLSGIRFSALFTGFSAIQIGGFYYNLSGQLVSAPSLVTGIRVSACSFSNANRPNGENTFGIFIDGRLNNSKISNVTIANNTMDQLGEAINVAIGGGLSDPAIGVVVEDITISGNTFSNNLVIPTSAVEIDIGGNGANNVMRRVRVTQNSFINNYQGLIVNVNGANSGGTIDSVEIARNLFRGHLQALGLVGGVDATSSSNTISNTRIVNNVIDTVGTTIQIIDNQNGGSNNRVTGVVFASNTIHAPIPVGSASGVWITSAGGVTGVSIANNIFSGSATPIFRGVTAAQVTYSIVNQAGFAGTNNNINVDPQFVSAAQGDFHLRSSSPARGAGTATALPATDFACYPRSGVADIGAYAFGSVGNQCTNPALVSILPSARSRARHSNRSRVPIVMKPGSAKP